MRRVTLLLSGVPQFVTLCDLSYNLDRLFNTDEIETFKIRDLPNHPHTNKRQIALDFRSGYDAMAAQEKLEGYTYELDNGREYTLRAKINKSEEYMCNESPEYGDSRWYGDDWTPLAMIPNVSDGEMYKAHARLDAQLELLKKQKLVLEKEKELLYERQRLKRKYGSMVRYLYEAPSTPQAQDQYVERPLQLTCDSETEVSPPKRSRSTSQDHSNSKHPRSRSREIRPHITHSGYILPEIEWYGERTKTRELRSHSGEHSMSHGYSRDRRSSSREPRDHRYPVSRHREPRSGSNEKPRYRRSPSDERGIRACSRSQDRTVHSREPRSREHRSRSRGNRSHSRERMYFRRSRSQDRISFRKSRSRERAHHNDTGVLGSDWDHGDRRLRSPDRRINQLAIMPRSSRGLPSEWSIDSSKAVTPTYTKYKADVKHKEVRIKVEKDAKNTTKRDTKENKTEITKKIKANERKKVDKYNSKIKKAEKIAFRIQALSKDVMILVAIVVDEIMDRDKIRISASNKVAFIKILEALIHERLEPLVRVKKNDDNEVLKKYKMQYPMEYDLKMIKQMLNEIPKLEKREPEATVTGSFVSDSTEKNNVVDIKVLDVDSESTGQQCNTNKLTQLDVISVERIDNKPQIKTEPKDEPILIIDIDSAEKPVPRHPHFFVVIKNLVKNMNKVIRANKLDGEITFAELKHVLRHILRNMLKGQGFVPREQIIRKFREIYPMENDEQFVRNTIKDISDGKYPGLTGHVGDTPESDCADDVVLVEKKYDVVTVTDSDDDVVEKKPSIEAINPHCEPTLDNSQTNPNRAMPGPRNDHVNRDQGTSPNSGHDQPRSNNVAQANSDLAKPGQPMTGPNKPGQAMTGPTNTSETTKASDNLGRVYIDAANVNQMNIGNANTGPIVKSAHLSKAKIGTAPRRDMPDLGSPVQVNRALDYPIQGQTGLVNPGQANTGLAKPSQAKKTSVNPSRDKPGPANASQFKAGLGNAGQAKICVPNCSQANTGLANFSQAKKGPNNPVQTKTGSGNLSQAKKGPNNLGQANTFNTHQTKKGSANPGQAKTGPGNPGQAKTVPANPSQAKIGPGNPGQATPGPVNASQAKKGPNNPQQVKKGPVKTSQAKSGLISGQAAPNNTMFVEENEKRASLDNTIHNLESLNNASNVDVVVISPPSVKVGRERKKRRRRRKRAGKEIQETPDSNQINQSNDDSKDNVNRNTNNEENDNYLKVTAITIVTSLNELIAKSTAKEPEKDILTDEIKKEIEIEEVAELDDSSLNLDNGARVTSITIMTSEAELFSLGNEDRKEVTEIKNETDVYYDAEDNLVNDIERALDDVNFGNIHSENIEQNSVNSEQFRSVSNSDQFSKRQCVPLDSRTVQDDEECIESIVKYVASMY